MGEQTYRVRVIECSKSILNRFVENVWCELKTCGIHADDKVGGGSCKLLVANEKAPL